MPVLAIGGEASFGENVGHAVRAVADDVESLMKSRSSRATRAA